MKISQIGDIFIAALIVVTYGSDAPCTNAGGHCQDDHLACHNGHYQSGMCSGGAHRRCCLTSASHTGSFSTGIVSQQCLQCICNVESGCKAIGCHFDVNSDSCGYFQIKEGYWHDCGSPGTSWRSCANDLDKNQLQDGVKQKLENVLVYTTS